MQHYILERISETLFSSGKLSVSIYTLLNDKGNNDGKAYPSTVLNLYNSSKYSNTSVLGELNFGRSSLIMGFEYNDRTANPAVRESVNFGEELITSEDMFNIVTYEQHILNNFSQIYVEGINNAYTINQANVPYFEIKNNRNAVVSFTPVIVNRIINNTPVPNPGIRVGIGRYFEDVTFNSFQYMVGQLATYNNRERLAALKDSFKLSTLILGQYRISEPRGYGGYGNNGGYQNYGQTRGGNAFNGGQFGGNQNQQNFNQAPNQNFNQQPNFGQPQNFNQGNGGQFGQPQNPFNQQVDQGPGAFGGGGPFGANPEDNNSNPFKRDEAATEGTGSSGSGPFQRFRRTDSAGKLDIDKSSTVKTEKTDLDTLSDEVNGSINNESTGGNLNASILNDVEKMTKEENLDMSELGSIMDEIN